VEILLYNIFSNIHKIRDRTLKIDGQRNPSEASS